MNVDNYTIDFLKRELAQEQAKLTGVMRKVETDTYVLNETKEHIKQLESAIALLEAPS